MSAIVFFSIKTTSLLSPQHLQSEQQHYHHINISTINNCKQISHTFLHHGHLYCNITNFRTDVITDLHLQHQPPPKIILSYAEDRAPSEITVPAASATIRPLQCQHHSLGSPLSISPPSLKSMNINSFNVFFL